jgi:fucose permease
VGAVALVLRRSDLPAPAAPVGDETRGGVPPRIRPTLIIVFAIVGLEFALSFWLATYLHDSLGVRRGIAVLIVSGLYGANLIGRVVASRAARRLPDAAVLGAALLLALAGLPLLLAAHSAWVAGGGVVLAGVGIGAMFPLTSSLHVASTGTQSDTSVGEVLAVAAFGQITGPLAAGALAQVTDLRLGLLVLPALTVLGLAALSAHGRQINRPATPVG